MITKICTKCKKELPATKENFYKNKDSIDELRSQCKNCTHGVTSKYYLKNKEKFRKLNKKTYEEKVKLLKDIVIKHCGGKCQCCGEDIPEFLTIDHVNGGGTKNRKEDGSGAKFYRKIIKEGFPDIYQILCWNCNCGRHINGGICPHKEK